MGALTNSITLISHPGTTSETLEALVDTAASFTSDLCAVLDRLEITAEWQVRLGIAEGRTTERGMGSTHAEIEEERKPIFCIFSPDDTLALICAYTQEAFPLMVYPVEQRLVRRDALWM